MNAQEHPRIRQIERASVVLRGLCTVLIAIVFIGTVVATIATVAGRLTRVSTPEATLQIPHLTAAMRLWVAALVVVTGAAVVSALYHLRRLLAGYARRQFFTTDAARHLRNFGLSCMMWGALEIVWAFVAWLLTPPPHPPVLITADALVIGAVVVVLAWFTEMATALREENELTI